MYRHGLVRVLAVVRRWCSADQGCATCRRRRGYVSSCWSGWLLRSFGWILLFGFAVGFTASFPDHRCSVWYGMYVYTALYVGIGRDKKDCFYSVKRNSISARWIMISKGSHHGQGDRCDKTFSVNPHFCVRRYLFDLNFSFWCCNMYLLLIGYVRVILFEVGWSKTLRIAWRIVWPCLSRHLVSFRFMHAL